MKEEYHYIILSHYNIWNYQKLNQKTLNMVIGLHYIRKYELVTQHNIILLYIMTNLYGYVIYLVI